MPRQKNFFVFDILDPGTDGDGRLGKVGVRIRCTADATVFAKPGMRAHLSAVAKELNALMFKRMAEGPPKTDTGTVPESSLSSTDDKSPRERALDGAQ
jgi:hypothetical protein